MTYQTAALLADPAGRAMPQWYDEATDKWYPVSTTHPLPVGGGPLGGLSDTILTDDSSTQFLARDNGITITYVTLAGAPYTPSTNIRALFLAGGATASKQDTGNASLATIATNSAKGQQNAAGSQSVVLSSDGPFATNFGTTTDAAATTDTGAFGLMAFIKRAMQNWTTLLSRVPALPTASVTGQVKIAVTGTAVQFPANALVNGIIGVALSTNSASMTIGGSTITSTVDGTGNGYIVQTGAGFSYAGTNSSQLWANGTAGDILTFAGN